jgi:cation-transporting P-type ATPase 13A2
MLSVFLSLYMVRSNLYKLRKLALNEITFNVVRNSQTLKVTSENIVPGDIILIENDMKLPCDCILIQGNCLIDEASLTGES